ncbi:MAG TPA: TonB-dependent receptor [Steroidobacteraceae bacterium]|nr:TonB-dependent receptor [Steroidobacteraceae bacterium]
MTRIDQRKRRLRAFLRRSGALAGVPLVSAMYVNTPALAQTAAEEEASLGHIVVTAQKRTENLQDVPVSIQAISTAQLEEQHINDFEDYAKMLPSVSFTTIGPGFGLAYMRGVASGENNNHSGPQPTVGMYLDEQPITTIQGSLDIHLYDVARVEALAGPQGTLYGASSEAGTIRIITNKPDTSGFDASYDLESNYVTNGGVGYVGQGFVNIPLSERAAVRLVGWYESDPGYIDNVVQPRRFPTSGGCIENSPTPESGCVSSPTLAKDGYNDIETYGARAALKLDLNDRWTVTPTLMGQKETVDGGFAVDPKLGDLKVTRYYPENSVDEWVQAALTVEGKIGNFDLVYAGAYLKRDDEVNSDYSDYAFFYDQVAGYGVYWTDDAGNPLADPSQYIHATDHYRRSTHELRLSSPSDRPFRFVAGLFTQRQEHLIFQNYQITGLASFLSVSGWPNTIWLTNQKRIDRDYAAFGEATYDFTDKLSATVGVRFYKTDNSLMGFFGFTQNYSSNYGEALCFSDYRFRNSPCTNLDDDVKDSGTIPKVNVTYHFDGDRMMYATYSKGFRPGGINRNGTVPPYDPDYLTNYEIGWKTLWLDDRIRFNGAVFQEKWTDIQFSFLPPSGSGLSVIRNAGSARIRGVEADIGFAASKSFTITTGLTYIKSELLEDYIQDPDDPLQRASKGDSLPLTPNFKANLTARYTFPLGSADGYVNASAVYQGSSWSDLLRADREAFGKQHSYTLANVSAGMERDSYSLELFVNNAFDKRAQLTTFAQCATVACGTQPYVVVNQPRTVGLKFGQKF